MQLADCGRVCMCMCVNVCVCSVCVCVCGGGSYSGMDSRPLGESGGTQKLYLKEDISFVRNSRSSQFEIVSCIH